MINLRDYQEEAINAIWLDIMSSQTSLCVMSTGSGKSIVIAGLMEKAILAMPEIKILVLFNKVTLLEQLSERFKALLGRDSVGVYCGSLDSYDNEQQITVGSIQSLKKDHVNYNLIIVDECHNLSDDGGRYFEFISHQASTNPKTKIVGFTATPFRSDGYIYGKGKFFKKPCFERGLKYFISRGMLVPPSAKQPDHQIDISKLRVKLGEYVQEDIDEQAMNVGMAKDQVIDALNRSVGRKKIVWFCSSIKHAEMIKGILLSFGENAVTVHSKLDWDNRDQSMVMFTEGESRHLTFVSIVSEGFDYPPIDAVVLMRPTRSPVLMVQTCGRGLRPYGEKENCLILDYANVISSIGPLDDPVIGKKPGKKGEIVQSQKSCPQCREYLPPRVQSCHVCGFEFPKLDAARINMTSDDEANFFEKKQMKFDVSSITMEKFVSKNDNLCIKMNYHSGSFFEAPLSEYFVVNGFGFKKFQIRAAELGLFVTSDIDEQCKQKITKLPSGLIYEMDGKYPRIKRMVFNDPVSIR